MSCGNKVPDFDAVRHAQVQIGDWLGQANYYNLLGCGLVHMINQQIHKELEQSRSTNEQDRMPEGVMEDMSIDLLEDGEPELWRRPR